MKTYQLYVRCSKRHKKAILDVLTAVGDQLASADVTMISLEGHKWLKLEVRGRFDATAYGDYPVLATNAKELGTPLPEDDLKFERKGFLRLAGFIARDLIDSAAEQRIENEDNQEDSDPASLTEDEENDGAESDDVW